MTHYVLLSTMLYDPICWIVHYVVWPTMLYWPLCCVTHYVVLSTMLYCPLCCIVHYVVWPMMLYSPNMLFGPTMMCMSQYVIWPIMLYCLTMLLYNPCELIVCNYLVSPILQKVLADYVSVELVFHARAIEYYSKCFENLANMDDEADLEVRNKS